MSNDMGGKTVSSLSLLAREIGRNPAAVFRWHKREDWPFGDGPYNVAEVAVWATRNIKHGVPNFTVGPLAKVDCEVPLTAGMEFIGEGDTDPAADQRAERVHLTPSLCRAWLERGGNFRKLNEGHIRSLMRSISVAGWKHDGSTFTVDDDRHLVDGQHRAAAICKLGVDVWAWVIVGVNPKQMPCKDSGKIRTYSEWLENAGYKQASVIASAVRRLGDLLMMETSSGRPSIPECNMVLDEHPTIVSSAKITRCREGSFRLGRVPQALLAAVHCLASEQDTNVADKFLAAIKSGLHLGSKDPVYQFRSRMLADDKSKAKLTLREREALLIKAWNFWITGRECKNLRWASSGYRAEAFPAMIMPDEVEQED
jgi:hypothetical protein